MGGGPDGRATVIYLTSHLEKEHVVGEKLKKYADNHYRKCSLPDRALPHAHETQYLMLQQLYLKVFPRPQFKDQELGRLSNVCADVNGMTIIILALFIFQNLFARITSLPAIVIIFLGIAYLALEGC